MKRVLILRDKDTKIEVFSEYLVIKNILNSYRVGFEQVEMLYINKSIDISLHEAFQIALKIPLNIIDADGYILGRLEISSEKV